ncbi:tape measure protein [Enterococcus avium]|uniref:aggregation-promoting factor C-terminal-like domain-containing protein n=1 Tax=Enterococcus avium TaxID=33945 RepID=UPI00288F0DBB|nr:tape measure protein [Enterococcus avium]MDT2467824.1 tape measure protein [Enterococcus avium]MDT2507182.1 tape measure protein [Enterococcus avium]
MGADATINIDVMLANLPKFKNDVSFVDDVLTKLGMNTGSKIDDSFKSETAKIETIAKSMKKDVDQTLDKPVKFTIKADNSDAERDVKETKAFLKDIPKSKITELKADNDGASLKIKSIKSEIAGVPDKKNTTLNADATQAKTETQELGRTAERTESKFMSLKDKLTIGAVAGIASNAIQVITGSFSELIGESVEASDSIDKFKSTMKLGGFGEKEINEATKIVQKYADDTVYDLSTVSNTTAQLAANGIKNYTELTQAAGNLNAQAGGSAETFKAVAMMLTQTAGAGKLTTENWNQLADAIPGASGVLQEAMKKNGAFTGNFRDAMEDGQISADEFNQAITELGMNDGAIEAAKSTTTFEGAIGNLQANIVGGINDIIKHLGKDKLTGMINGASDSVVGFFEKISGVFTYLDDNKNTVGSIVNSFKEITKVFASGVWSQAKDIALSFAEGLGLVDSKARLINDPLKRTETILKSLAGHKTEIELLGKALVMVFAVNQVMKFTAAVGKFMEMIGGAAILSNPVFLIAAGVVAIGVAAYKAYQEFKPFRDFVDGLVGSFKKFASGAKESISNFADSAKEKFSDAKDAISDNFSKIKKSLSGVGDNIQDSFKESTKFLKNNWKEIGLSILNPVVGATAALYKHNPKFKEWADDSLEKMSDGFKKFKSRIIDPIIKNIRNLFGEISEQFDEWRGNFSKNLSKFGKTLGKTVEVIFWLIWGPIRLLGRSIKSGFEDLVDWIKPYLEKAGKSINKVVTRITDTAQDILDSFVEWTKDIFSSLNKSVQKAMRLFERYIVDPINDARKSALKTIDNLIERIVDYFDNLYRKARNQWRDIKNAISRPINEARENVLEILNNMRAKASDIFERIKSNTRSAWNAIKRYTIEPIQDAYRSVTKAVGNIYSEVSKYWDRLKQSTFEKFDNIVSYMKKVPGRIGEAFSSGKEAVGNGVRAVAQYMADILGKGVNGVIGGINWVLDKVDAPKSVRVSKWDIPKFATGGTHRGGLMLVNDGDGEELVRHPDGKMEIPKGRNVLMNADPGTQVLNHQQTKAFAQTFGIPMYANGIVSNISDFFKDTWGNIKDIGEDVMDAIEHPVEFVKKAISKHVDIKATHPTFDIATGGVKKVTDGAMEWIKSKIAEFGAVESGSFDGAMNANGVYQYLVNVAEKVIRKFGSGFYVSSGYRPGDQYHHGQHQAIDIAIPGAILSPLYTKAANYAFEKFPKEVGYVITNGMVRDRMGYTHGGTSGKWVPWGSTDHDNHVHISGRMGSGDIYHGNTNSGGTNAKPTGGHQNWMKQAGFSPSEYAAIDYIVNHESSWNPQAVNASSGAYGLPQSLPASKLASAGSDWRTNPITQLKWMRNYVNERYGGANGALSFWKANHWYANGGEVDKPTLAWIGEDPNYAKEFIINPAKDSADLLIQKAIAAREQYKPTPSAQNYSSNNNSTGRFVTQTDLNQLINKINERPVKVNSILDGKQVGHSVDQTNAGTLKRKLYTARRA